MSDSPRGKHTLTHTHTHTHTHTQVGKKSTHLLNISFSFLVARRGRRKLRRAEKYNTVRRCEFRLSDSAAKAREA